MSDRPFVLIHADESCLGNQFQGRANPGGGAGLVETWKDGRWVRRDYWLAEPDTTNNRMALRSAIGLLGALTRACRITFVSDSQYLVKGMNEWRHGWKKRGWVRKGGAIENLELWKTLDRADAAHDITWRWVRGHAGDARNEYADHLATTAARTQKSSRGLVESGFEAWLQEQRDSRERFLDFYEFVGPDQLGL